jgi:hypothetical protein
MDDDHDPDAESRAGRLALLLVTAIVLALILGMEVGRAMEQRAAMDVGMGRWVRGRNDTEWRFVFEPTEPGDDREDDD